MLAFLREWLQQILGAALLLAAVSVLTPPCAARRIALLCGSAIFLLALLRPLTGGELPQLAALPELTQSIAQQKERYEGDNLQQWASLIEEETRTYIEGKAAELDFPCTVAVRAEAQGDRIVLREVTVTAAEENPTLAACLTGELGLTAEQIRWRIT